MKKIILTAAAVLAITGSAFAGSDNYGSNGANQPAVSVYSSYTASIQKPAHADKQPVVQGADRDLYGNR
ncbi:DUF680 domain-containing protein [Mesorhizobium sp. C416B]|uniref:DUF680 domain-containing protein n=1 Tax=unclassified Mesorhizobium TaxID=325217 RepID=UPI0003CE895B|nr:MULTISPECIES: DUF680 domain-containing protein [unclassified Mesorhizobium]ESX48111.1 hypothetical protein X762_14895 [Mesorhizobium sp. LSHC426A00]ESX53654.1 hypothetical protein X761_19250 [Mesorhizobium sp. LSHC424B00]ESX73729.1 hypothetical protein X758_08370 [Mesorhizobium sp. LSHC416B00]WJI60198.1 DUF680 domain-containing protein [Mesorhizobium sp. C416B]